MGVQDRNTRAAAWVSREPLLDRARRIPRRLDPLDEEIVLPSMLTNAERAVATLLARGSSLTEIARARCTSPRTIANQARAIYRKLGVGSRLELGVLLRAPRED